MSFGAAKGPCRKEEVAISEGVLRDVGFRVPLDMYPRMVDQIVETMRKLILTGGLIFLGPGTSEQIAISIIICLCALRIFSGFKPFVKESHDRFIEDRAAYEEEVRQSKWMKTDFDSTKQQ